MKFTTKLIALLLFAVGMSNISFGQEYQSEVELIQATIGKDKKDFVTEMVTIPADKNEEFWKLYNEYESVRKEQSVNRVQLVQKYVQGFSNNSLDASSIKKLVKDVMSAEKGASKNICKYYTKMFKKVSPTTAMQFFQVENYLLDAINTAIYGNLPM